MKGIRLGKKDKQNLSQKSVSNLELPLCSSGLVKKKKAYEMAQGKRKMW